MNSPEAILLITHITEWAGVVAVAVLLSRLPRNVFKPIGYMYPRRDGIMAISLSVVAIISAVVLSSPQMAGFSLNLFRLEGPAAQLSLPLTIAIVSLLPALISLIFRTQPLRSAGWNRATLRMGLQTGIALALLTILLRNRAVDLFRGIPPEKMTWLLAGMGIAFAEETLFRGYIQSRLGWWLGANRGWILTSLIFAAYRFPVILATQGLPAAFLGLAIALGQGLVAGFLMQKCGHVLGPALYRSASIWMDAFI